MNIVEHLISLLAPHLCLACKAEGSPFCEVCAIYYLRPPPTIKSVGSLKNVWAATEYEGYSKELVKQLKYGRMKAIAGVLAREMDRTVPKLTDALVVPVPTVNNRARQRGYDQACLIARSFARRRGLQYIDMLYRTKNTRQVGTSRKQRYQQLEGVFSAYSPARAQNKHILLIDDVYTSGATVASAARTIRSRVDRVTISAATFAYKP